MKKIGNLVVVASLMKQKIITVQKKMRNNFWENKIKVGYHFNKFLTKINLLL
jgi:hypothetical protein